MTRWIKQSTAVDVVIGPFVDDADGKTPETGLTISQADCQLTKNGGAVAQKNDANSASHLGGGHYKVPLNTTDTGTLGQMRLYVNETGALPVWVDFMVVPANVWDSFFSSDKLQVHVDEMTAGIITAAVIATGAVDADAIATDAVTEIQSGLATAAALATVDGIVDDILVDTGTTLPGTLLTIAGYLDTEIAAILADTNELQTDWANGGRLDLLIDAILADTGELQTDWVNGGRLDLLIDAILADTGELQTDWVNGGRLDLILDARASQASVDALNDLSAAEVNAQVVDALATDTYAEPGSVPAATASLKDKIGWIYMMTRNKRITTATADKVRNDADSSDVATAVLSEDGSTFTSGKFAS